MFISCNLKTMSLELKSEGKVNRTFCIVPRSSVICLAHMISWKVAYVFLEGGAYTYKVKPYNKQPLIFSYMKFHPVVTLLTAQE